MGNFARVIDGPHEDLYGKVRERERPLVNDTARKRGRKDLALFYFRSLLLMTKTQQSS